LRPQFKVFEVRLPLVTLSEEELGRVVVVVIRIVRRCFPFDRRRCVFGRWRHRGRCFGDDRFDHGGRGLDLVGFVVEREPCGRFGRFRHDGRFRYDGSFRNGGDSFGRFRRRFDGGTFRFGHDGGLSGYLDYFDHFGLDRRGRFR
jgi:hypothetical protein